MAVKRLYLLLTLLLPAGYSWLLWFDIYTTQNAGFTPCVFKTCTGLPCPSCGTTRSVSAIFNGDFNNALLINPLGYVTSLLMVILPVWLVYDAIIKKRTLFTAYKKTERVIKNKFVAIILFLLITANWIWNIYKNI